jgi:hypothetical protein
MAVGRALLVIADIRGYTPFMRLHRTSLAHARTYFMDLAEIAGDAPPKPRVTALATFRENCGVVLRSLPYLLGLKRRRFAARGLTAA